MFDGFEKERKWIVVVVVLDVCIFLNMNAS
jgi:hypothetical protein